MDTASGFVYWVPLAGGGRVISLDGVRFDFVVLELEEVEDIFRFLSGCEDVCVTDGDLFVE